MNVRQKTLTALLVLGIGVSGCNINDNNLIPQIVNKKTDDRNKTIDNNKTVDQNNTEENRTAIILSEIGNQHSDHNSTVTVAQLKAITPTLENINADYENIYQTYIASRDSNFSSPATRDEVQNMINVIDRDDGNGGENNNTNATATILESIGSQHSKGESNITVAQLKAIIPLLRDINDNYQDIYRNYIANTDNSFSSPATRDEVQSMIGDVNRLVSVSDATLADIATQHSSHKSTLTVAKLKAILPALENINDDYENIYRTYIVSADKSFSSPATRDEVQRMIEEVNGLNLPAHAIVDRSFFKKTNNKFEHKFVYLPVTNSTTGRTWLNNNLGAEYANKNSSDYNPSQQATAGDDYRAYGSMFQWGRKADGHELMTWTDAAHGTGKYGTTSTQANTPSNPLSIISSNDWRVTQDDTLWASESSQNNVCPVGYRLPLNPNGTNDNENEFYQEMQTWTKIDTTGALLSTLALPVAGWKNGNTFGDTALFGNYWNGSVDKKIKRLASNIYFGSRKSQFGLFYNINDNSDRAYGLTIRCIKD